MTTYAHATGTAVDQVGTPPALVYQDGRWWDLRTLDPATLAACGWLPVTTTPRPADTDTTTSDYSVQLVNGAPVEVWTARPWTTDEQAARTARAARDADRLAIIEQAIVRLQADSQAAAARAQTITDAVTAINAQVTSVQGYTFAGANVSAINVSLNTALKPQIVSILQKLAGVGSILAGLETRRAQMDDEIVWLARYVTSD